jgi:DNA polymerase-4
VAIAARRSDIRSAQHRNGYHGGVSLDRPPEPILHLDMDAFYAAVEVLDDPALAGHPVLVGGTGARGVVASASYEARAYGIGSAMPMARARRLCPQPVILPPRFDRYREVSAALLDLLHEATPAVEPLSLDEAFLDVGGARRLLGEPVDIARWLWRRIRDELALPASVGVAPTKHLAKLASQHAKPTRSRSEAGATHTSRRAEHTARWLIEPGCVHLPAGDTAAFLEPLPVGALWGVGEATAGELARFGVRTVADVGRTDRAVLARIVGPAAAEQLSELAAGRDERAVTPYEPAKGLSAEETFEHDVDDPEVLRRELLRLAETVARRLRGARLAARTVTLKLRDAAFATLTRSRTLATPGDQAAVLHGEVTAALEALGLQRVRIRLIGVGATNLVPTEAARQLDLLGDDRWTRLEQATDAAHERFGDGTVTRGALLGSPAADDDPAPSGQDRWPRGT